MSRCIDHISRLCLSLGSPVSRSATSLVAPCLQLALSFEGAGILDIALLLRFAFLFGGAPLADRGKQVRRAAVGRRIPKWCGAVMSEQEGLRDSGQGVPLPLFFRYSAEQIEKKEDRAKTLRYRNCTQCRNGGKSGR